MRCALGGFTYLTLIETLRSFINSFWVVLSELYVINSLSFLHVTFSGADDSHEQG